MTRSIRKLSLALAAAGLLSLIMAGSASATAPGVTTEAATVNDIHSATLHATIETYGYETVWAFEYGTTTAYGSQTEPKVIPAGEKGPTQVSAAVASLTPGATYHFRALALTSGGEGSRGGDRTVTMSGLYMTGSGTETDKARLASTEELIAFSTHLPTHVPTGQEFTVLSAAGVTVKCSQSSLVSTPGAAGSIYAGFFGGTFSKCTSEATVAMNGCYYKYAIANTAPPYTGSVSKVVCPTGQKIELSIPYVCNIKIPGQVPSSSTVSYEDTNYEGKSGAVNLATVAEGLTFEKEEPGGGGYCGFIFTNGSKMEGNLLIARE